MAIRVGIISLGCTKNLIDSEVMLGLLGEKGYEITPYEDEADILIVNTCAFIDSARQESIDTILQLTNGQDESYRKIIVTGCLAQRYGDQLKGQLGNGIHAVVGAGDFHHIVDICEAVLAGKSFVKRVSRVPAYLYDHNTPRLRTTPAHFAYVKIAEGCDNCCSYCIIPRVRGRYRSRSIESVAAEVSSLAQAGVREVNLIAQDTTYYGQDLGNGVDLPSLLKRLIRISDISWIRILYGHPAHISDKLLTMIASEQKICKYIDVPVQHIEDEILRKMGRPMTGSQIYDLIFRIRDVIPEVALRTSLIVGFPGETERHFEALMRFVEQIEFDHLGVFTYSAEAGTKAGVMQDQIPEPVKEDRLDRIAQLHEQISARKRRRLIGKQEVVLVDMDGLEAAGRTQGQAPEIDDVVYIDNARACKRGEFVKVEITDTCGSYDLVGRLMP